VKLARTNPSLAFVQLEGLDFAGNPEHRGLMYGLVGQFLAKKQDHKALEAYKRQHQSSDSYLLSPESLEWKVRAALKEKDWKFVRDAIDGMPDHIRMRDPAWTYWYGRALKELKDPKANEYFAIVSPQHNFYGQLALEELNKPIVIPPKVSVTDVEISTIAHNHPAFDKAAKLYAMNLRTEGNREWNWELRDLSDKELIAAAEYGKRIGLLDRTVNTADRTKLEHNFSLRFPTPYLDKLQSITHKINLDINWVYGLIRQESRFIVAAKSGVGASGLMQVMPTTGKYVAKKIGLNDFRVDTLSEVNTNLMIGCNYLNMVLNDLDGSWGLASAAYNAGPSRPKQWRQTLKHPVDGAIFAETIPFNETRNYVKNVLSNSIYYANLTGKSQSLKEKLGNVYPAIAVTSNLP
jgi:soluble lytic murein transglycosylase